VLDLILIRACLVTFFIYYALIAGFRAIRVFFSYIVICVFYVDFIILIHSCNITVALASKILDYIKF
jgi:hypothetical protein